MVYDMDLMELYKNTFTDPAYKDYPQLQQLGRHAADFSSGYGIYQFTEDAASNKVVPKECYWTAVSAYGEEWCIALKRTL